MYIKPNLGTLAELALSWLTKPARKAGPPPCPHSGQSGKDLTLIQNDLNRQHYQYFTTTHCIHHDSSFIVLMTPKALTGTFVLLRPFAELPIFWNPSQPYCRV